MGVQPETVNHIFWHCDHTKRLWKDIAKLISDKVYVNFNLHFEHVIFGFHSDTTEDLDKVFVINLVILYAKFHIHRAKFTGDKPNFSIFYKCFELYLQSLTLLENKKAIKTKNICEKFISCYYVGILFTVTIYLFIIYFFFIFFSFSFLLV